MTADILIAVPVLARPQNARPLVESLIASGSTARVAFVCSPDDTEEESACIAAISLRAQYLDAVYVMDDGPGPGDYAKKIQHAYERDGDIPYVLCAADDLRFHPGWDSAALEVAREFDVGVVGTNDRANPSVIAGRHSTHPLVARAYVDSMGGYVDGIGKVYFDGYSHQMVDSELVETAKARGCYAHCHASIVEHRHPIFDRSVPRDDTYRRGQRDGAADRALFDRRSHLWLNERVEAA